MEETREQPIIMPATALQKADIESAMSEVGSQNNDNLGKFKSVEALMDAYNSLQAEFTKKCQALSQLQKDKTELEDERVKNEENSSKLNENDEISDEKLENNDNFNEEALKQFLETNSEAKEFEEEIRKRFTSPSPSPQSPYEVAWADVVLSHIKEKDKVSDPIINQYVLSDESVKNKIIENYLRELDNSRPPIIMSSQSGERLSGVTPDNPKTLADAKKMMSDMFS